MQTDGEDYDSINTHIKCNAVEDWVTRLHTVQFKNRGMKLCGFSCNTASSHRRWIRDSGLEGKSAIEESKWQCCLCIQTVLDAESTPSSCQLHTSSRGSLESAPA